MRLLYTIFLLIFLSACVSYIEPDKIVKKIVSDFPNDEGEYKSYLILSENFCGYCPNISDSVVINSVLKNYPIRVIFVYREKNLNSLFKKFDSDILQNKKIFIDTERKYHYPIQDDKAYYPMILYLKKNRITKVEFQNEKNPYAIFNLIKFLEK